VEAIATKAPALANILIQNPLSKSLLRSLFGIVSTPRFSESLRKGLAHRNAILLDIDKLPARESLNANQVILLPDSFNASYSAEVLLAAFDILRKLGYEVLVAPLLRNGKALQVKGFRDRFKRQASQQVEQMKRLAATGLPLISTEVVTRLMHEKEYVDVLGNTADYRIWSIENWLVTQIEQDKLEIALDKGRIVKDKYLLLPHCMEQTADRQSAQDWKLLFEKLGLSMTTKAAGCCGMAGLFGHERENQKLSDDIFKLNWQGIANASSATILASGFSCRCQLHKHGLSVEHPLSILSKII
jgi:Fe-S oxidoreductase